MILAGTIISNYSIRNNIAIIYRSQFHSNTEKIISNNLPMPIRNFQLRGSLKKAFYTNKPDIHSSLGLDYYCQCTSPIRRYSDFINNMQITSYLINEPTYSHSEISTIINQLRYPMSQASMIMREDKEVIIFLYDFFFLNKGLSFIT